MPKSGGDKQNDNNSEHNHSDFSPRNYLHILYHSLRLDNVIIERWKGYYGKLLNEENPRKVFSDGVPHEGLTPAINSPEVEVALNGMKHGKAMGPDGIPVEVWKSLGEEGVDMLLDLLQKIFEREKIPEEWRDSMIVSILKEKGDIQDCANYRGIKIMKIWESIIDRRLRKETSIGEEQFGFMPGRGTTDAIFAARQVIEKHREMQKELHLMLRRRTAGYPGRKSGGV